MPLPPQNAVPPRPVLYHVTAGDDDDVTREWPGMHTRRGRRASELRPGMLFLHDADAPEASGRSWRRPVLGADHHEYDLYPAS